MIHLFGFNSPYHKNAEVRDSIMSADVLVPDESAEGGWAFVGRLEDLPAAPAWDGDAGVNVRRVTIQSLNPWTALGQPCCCLHALTSARFEPSPVKKPGLPKYFVPQKYRIGDTHHRTASWLGFQTTAVRQGGFESISALCVILMACLQPCCCLIISGQRPKVAATAAMQPPLPCSLLRGVPSNPTSPAGPLCQHAQPLDT